MSRVSIENVSKLYDGSGDGEGKIVAVDGVTLDIEDGEFLTIVGPSGSGKSTLLRMVAGLEDISSGTIRIGDRVVNDIQPQDRGVAMVFQNYALYPHMSTRKNMAYGLKLTSDLSDDEVQQRVEEAAEMMGIEDQLGKKPGSLSGGQQQRVATGRAIVRDPEVFLMDEPLSNLDAKLRAHMRTEIQRIHEELGTTFIYVTHDQEEAMTMSDRVAILNHGEVQQIGTPDEIYNEPKNLFVADFVGSPAMNTFDVTFDGTTLTATDFEYELSSTRAERVRERAGDDASLVLGIRPEDIHIAEADAENAIETILDVREPVGSDNYLYLEMEGVEECRVRVPGDVKPREGEALTVSFDEDDIHLFRASDGENILAEERGQHEVTA
ncbi:multiple sugar transport system ATP-binding protein [Halarchaeum solikamskense]|uniref:ABC transporter ATP-binding protein n=1 Tax=Halarchaeum nitratireducens TaxID=489913 RepID=UPI001B3B0821|nr:sn-glycerol-3-phosphate ABC transporter ATP-binding protein UgpC [Halarchaeum solikamskense]MBP2252363.1 multiple sugar transport system ATP-binding protein [Halarchaeum solikamskense]